MDTLDLMNFSDETVLIVLASAALLFLILWFIGLFIGQKRRHELRSTEEKLAESDGQLQQVSAEREAVYTEFTSYREQAKSREHALFSKVKVAEMRAHEQLKNHKQLNQEIVKSQDKLQSCLLYTSPSPRDATLSRMPSSA